VPQDEQATPPPAIDELLERRSGILIGFVAGFEFHTYFKPRKRKI
jgi:hypothetical protein